MVYEKCIKSTTLGVDFFRCIVVGGYTYENYDRIYDDLDAILANKVKEGKKIELVVYDEPPRLKAMPHGKMQSLPSTTTIVQDYAYERKYVLTRAYLPVDEKNIHAGPFRDYCMIEYADAIVAFWHKKDKTLKNIITLAKKKGLPSRVILVRY